MQYCPENITLWEVWVNNGTSQCFMDTVMSFILLIYLSLFGFWELQMYRKYGIPQLYNDLPKSKLYYVQLFFTYFLSFLGIVRFIVQAVYVYDGHIYAFMVSIEYSKLKKI